VDNDIAIDMLIPWQEVDIQSEKRKKRNEQDVSRQKANSHTPQVIANTPKNQDPGPTKK